MPFSAQIPWYTMAPAGSNPRVTRPIMPSTRVAADRKPILHVTPRHFGGQEGGARRVWCIRRGAVRAHQHGLRSSPVSVIIAGVLDSFSSSMFDCEVFYAKRIRSRFSPKSKIGGFPSDLALTWSSGADATPVVRGAKARGALLGCSARSSGRGVNSVPNTFRPAEIRVVGGAIHLPAPTVAASTRISGWLRRVVP